MKEKAHNYQNNLTAKCDQIIRTIKKHNQPSTVEQIVSSISFFIVP